MILNSGEYAMKIYNSAGKLIHDHQGELVCGDFQDLDLEGADFSSTILEGANFSGANLEGAGI